MEHYSSHFNPKGKTIDLESEKPNFKHAGKSLCEIRSEMMIDNYSVKAIYVEPPQIDKIKQTSGDIDQERYVKHVHTSQYLLQIVKCNLEDFCGSRRNFFEQNITPPMFTSNLQSKTIDSNGCQW